MLGDINSRFNRAKNNQRAHDAIVESIVAVEEVLPGSEQEFEDITDVDSVPADVYKKVDKILDDIVGKEDYDDTEAEELVDDPDEDEISDADLDAILSENCGAWYDDEDMGHPDVNRRSGAKHQAKFTGSSIV